MFKFTQSLCPQLASSPHKSQDISYLLLLLVFPLMPGGCSLLLRVVLGELGLPIHSYVPPKQKHS